MSSKSSNALIQKLLQAEEEADKIVKVARENRVKKLREAKLSAEEEMKVFKKKEEERFAKELNDKHGNSDTTAQELEASTKREIDLVKKDYRSNKDAVIQFLVNTVTEVDLSIPDVAIRQLQEAK